MKHGKVIEMEQMELVKLLEKELDIEIDTIQIHEGNGNLRIVESMDIEENHEFPDKGLINCECVISKYDSDYISKLFELNYPCEPPKSKDIVKKIAEDAGLLLESFNSMPNTRMYGLPCNPLGFNEAFNKVMEDLQDNVNKISKGIIDAMNKRNKPKYEDDLLVDAWKIAMECLDGVPLIEGYKGSGIKPKKPSEVDEIENFIEFKLEEFVLEHPSVKPNAIFVDEKSYDLLFDDMCKKFRKSLMVLKRMFVRDMEIFSHTDLKPKEIKIGLIGE
jgi:hypothetical protein